MGTFSSAGFRVARRGSLAVMSLSLSVFIAACGTTSNLRTSQGQGVTTTRKFSKVTVQDFKISVPEFAEKAASAKTYFPDRIADDIRKTGRFASVSRNAKPDAATLVIDGVVTKYVEGNAELRFWIGMGAGSALMEANVDFRDNNRASIGTIKVDKNSWALGGAIAAGQNPQSFMDGAADKIATEALKLVQ